MFALPPVNGRYFFCFVHRLTRKRVYVFFEAYLVRHYIFLQLSADIFFYRFYCDLLCLHNILCTKSDESHTCISNLHVCRISSGYFFLSVTQRNLIHLFLAVWIQACGYDPGKRLPRKRLTLPRPTPLRSSVL
jgi:hypothetical protein